MGAFKKGITEARWALLNQTEPPMCDCCKIKVAEFSSINDHPLFLCGPCKRGKLPRMLP